MTAVATAPLILRGTPTSASLAGESVIVTGGGGGIGLEAARSLLLLGASVAVAELDPDRCAAANASLSEVADAGRFMTITTDVGDEAAVRRLVAAVRARFGKVDVVLNNATYSPAGQSVVEMSAETWDRSYAVNLRGPALLARECLPAMVERRHGAFVCVSSTGGPFLAAYETLKAAQVALANSLDAELGDTGVVAFTIGPGLVPTQTAVAAIERIAPRLGMSVEEFWRINAGAVLSVEAAGAGFAAAIVLAARYAGQEISSSQALVDAGISLAGDPAAAPAPAVAGGPDAAAAAAQVRRTLEEQAAGWKQRSFFERQWMLREFKQRVGVPVERCIETLASFDGGRGAGARPLLQRLAAFYAHMGELAAGYVTDPDEREGQLAIVATWKSEVERLIASLPA